MSYNKIYHGCMSQKTYRQKLHILKNAIHVSVRQTEKSTCIMAFNINYENIFKIQIFVKIHINI